MKNRVLGITVLLAVGVLGLMFTACPDGEEREVTFVNNCNTTIDIVCQGSTPATVTLIAPAKVTSPGTRATVTRKGQDVVLTSLAFSNFSPTQQENWTDYIEISGSITGGKGAKKGITLGSGIVTFNIVKIDGNPAYFKISTIPLD